MIGPGAAALVVGGVCGCAPDLPEAGMRQTSGPDAGVALSVTVEPAAPLDAVPRALRVRLRAGQPLDPAATALVRGPVGPGQMREIAAGKVSKALGERLVQAEAWREGEEVVIAPIGLLEPGEEILAVAAETAETATLRAAEGEGPLPAVWPPEGGATTAPFAVWCGDGALPRVDEPVQLAPGGPAARVRRGAVEGGAGMACLRLEGEAGAEGRGVTPPAVAGLGLTPVLIQADGTVGSVPELGCEADETPFGPGCARFADDRAAVRTPPIPLLWAIAGAGVDRVIAAGAGDPFVISGLPPATDILLDVAAVDGRGTVLRMLTSAVTAAPMAHVVLNEVLANPLGPEPDAEWVEIVNDGAASVALDGYLLVDGGGATALPPATLPPGAFALLVNQGFDEQGGSDPAPAPGTMILRVPHLGTKGLANAGEPLSLVDPTGVVVSRFPASPKPKAGLSVARRSPETPDDAKDGFVRAVPTPGSPNVR
jgi:hypothetical protein